MAISATPIETNSKGQKCLIATCQNQRHGRMSNVCKRRTAPNAIKIAPTIMIPLNLVGGGVGGGVGCSDAGGGCEDGASAGFKGTMIHAMMYAKIPAPQTKVNTTHNSRMSVGSILRYSPKPPQTPPSILSVLDL